MDLTQDQKPGFQDPSPAHCPLPTAHLFPPGPYCVLSACLPACLSVRLSAPSDGYRPCFAELGLFGSGACMVTMSWSVRGELTVDVPGKEGL